MGLYKKKGIFWSDMGNESSDRVVLVPLEEGSVGISIGMIFMHLGDENPNRGQGKEKGGVPDIQCISPEFSPSARLAVDSAIPPSLEIGCS